MNIIILGAGFGDEGKGLMTDYFSNNTTVVVRFSGGHQAGHTVVNGSDRHVFSNFGSGTFNGAITYWSRYCTLHPQGVAGEYPYISHKNPRLYVDPLAPVTTFYDIFYNRASEAINQHGSCGVGFAATIQRHTESPYKLFVRDLFYPKVLKVKLDAIRDYYRNKVNHEVFYAKMYWENDFERAQTQYLEWVEAAKPIINIIDEKSFFMLFGSYDIVFEGSQGILLDMDHGFAPNVTRSYTTSRNALEIVNRNKLAEPEICYVTRSYQTRHGNGWMSDESLTLDIIEETNKPGTWQGNFRTGALDYSLLRYALDCDKNYSHHLVKNIAITCLDHIKINTDDLVEELDIHDFDSMYKSFGNTAENVRVERIT